MNKLLFLIDKEIRNIINEQFNIGNMNLNDNKPKRNVNIFNKAFTNPYYQNILDGTATEDEIKMLNSLVSVTKPENIVELKKIIEFYSNNCPDDSLNWIDVSGITNMSHLFADTEYDGDISKWDTSNVTDMNNMFCDAEKFNHPIGEWNVGNVTDMHHMFYNAYNFNQDIGKWDVSHVTDMHFMFSSALLFNKPIGGWDVSMVTDMNHMFEYAKNFN